MKCWVLVVMVLGACGDNRKPAGSDGGHPSDAPPDSAPADVGVGAAPAWPSGAQLDLVAVDSTSATVAWPEATDDVAVTEYQIRVDGTRVATVPAAEPRTWIATGLVWSQLHAVEIVAADAEGHATAGPKGRVAAIPPDPSTLAPPLAAAIPTVDEEVAFLWQGPKPTQVGVVAGTLDPVRTAVVRGRCLTPAGVPLPGVIVTVLDHPEDGNSVTRADGTFDLVVAGGGRVVVAYERTGLLRAQRAIATEWHDFFTLPDVVLIPRDTSVTAVTLGAATAQIARASAVTDAAGTRRATVVVPAGVTAQLVMPDGSQQALSTIHVRATEYTVGGRGPAAMPASLPTTSAYTYALELAADEAEAAGAKTVEFSSPVTLLVEDLVGLPVGSAVPMGAYDPDAAMWRGAKNGIVLKVVGVTGGVATIDTDGDDVADAPARLAAVGIDAAELAAIGSLYGAGQKLWSVPVPHFSSWDPNQLPRFPVPPNIASPVDADADGARDASNCRVTGSVIVCNDQVLEESVAITGTPLALRYASDRGVGRTEAFTRVLHLTGPVAPMDAPPLTFVELRWTVEIAGRVYTGVETSPGANLDRTFVWDGRDAYGRRIGGRRLARVTLTYGFSLSYEATPYGNSTYGTFGLASGEGQQNLTTVVPNTTPGRQGVDVTRVSTAKIRIGTYDATSAGLGGWELDVVHALDRESAVVDVGHGEERRLDPAGRSLARVGGAADGAIGTVVDGPALDTPLAGASALVALPDGAIAVAVGDGTIRTIDRAGVMHRIAGVGGLGFAGDGGPALAATFGTIGDLAAAGDGTLYVLDSGRIRQIGRDGIVTTIAGDGDTTCTTAPFCIGGIDGPAVALQVGGVSSIAAGPDGSLFLADPYAHQIRRISPNGRATTYAGAGATAPVDGMAAPYAKLGSPDRVRTSADGSVYFADTGIVYRVAPDGTLYRFAGTAHANCTVNNSCGDGGPAIDAQFGSILALATTRDGAIFTAEKNSIASFAGTPSRVRSIDLAHVISAVAGRGQPCLAGPCGDGGNAIAAQLDAVRGLAVAADGSLWILDLNRLRRVALPSTPVKNQETYVPSRDGHELWVFDAEGRHQRTLDALTNAPIWTFGYDAAHRLITLTDRDGNVTTVMRDADGAPLAIVAPGGETTTLQLGPDGLLARVATPGGLATAAGYDANGLLTSLTDPGGGVHAFQYANGRLVRDEAPGGHVQTLARTIVGARKTVTITTAEGRTTTFVRELGPDGDHTSSTDPAGATTEEVITSDGTSTTTHADGSVIVARRGPDPRWGLAVPQIVHEHAQRPSGASRDVTITRVATLAAPSDPFSLASLVTTTDDGAGTVTTSTWTASTRTLHVELPDGQSRDSTFDARGHLVGMSGDGAFDPLAMAYDATGLLTSSTRGSEQVQLTYDANRRLASLDDRAVHVAFAHDADARLTSETYAGAASYGFGYDAAGRASTLSAPGVADHVLGRDGADAITSSRRPSGATTTFTHDLEGLDLVTTLPSGRAAVIARDPGGRVISTTTNESTTTITWGDATTRPARVTRTPTLVGSAQTIARLYDGPLVVREALSGATGGTFDYTYDAGQRLIGATLSGATPAATTIARTFDGRRAQVGPFTFAFTGPGTSLASIGDGNHVVAYTAAASGRLAQRTQTVGGVPIYALALTYDASGRVTGEVETVAGATHTRTYTRGPTQELATVALDGTQVEAYRWDARGNRIGRTTGAAAEVVASFDADDQVVANGATAYTYVDGMLAGRGADTFEYGTRRELMRATVGGQAIVYEYDGFGRRVRRTAPSGTTEYLYGDPERMLVVTHVRDGHGLSILHYDDAGHLIALERGGVRYAVATDLVGTPRVVTDAAGAVVERIDRDRFGVLVGDTAPAFALPIGFGGGLDDPLTGLTLLGLRDYEAATGRFTVLDPTLFDAADPNLYDYASGDPASFRDPFGLWSFNASYYMGVGVGFTIASEGRGKFSFCVESGVGLGTSVDLSLTKGLDTKGVTAKFEGEVGNGFVGVTGALTTEDLTPLVDAYLSACPLPSVKIKPSAKFRFLGLTADTVDGPGYAGGTPLDLVNAESLADFTHVGAIAKLTVQGCDQFNVPW